MGRIGTENIFWLTENPPEKLRAIPSSIAVVTWTKIDPPGELPESTRPEGCVHAHRPETSPYRQPAASWQND
jgi:hypothetical protein